jgi:hypothetical protein
MNVLKKCTSISLVLVLLASLFGSAVSATTSQGDGLLATYYDSLVGKNNTLLINAWYIHAPTYHMSYIDLTADQLYDIKIEFFENGGGAVAQLDWYHYTTGWQTIPQANLFSNEDVVSPTAIVNYSTTAPTIGGVTATMTPSEPVTITNNGGSDSYTFTENGTFTFEFQDASENEGTAVATVTNIDKAAPVLHVVVDTSVLKVPNYKLVTIHAVTNAQDEGSGIASVVLTSITSNEPDGESDDIQHADYGTGDTSFDLRAERAGNNTGRIYTITYTASDLADNVTEGSTTVTVPHDQGNSEKKKR